MCYYGYARLDRVRLTHSTAKAVSVASKYSYTLAGVAVFFCFRPPNYNPLFAHQVPRRGPDGPCRATIFLR